MAIESDLTAQEKVDRAKIEVTSESPFFAYIVTKAEFEPDPSFHALAGVFPNGKAVYNPNKINPYPQGENDPDKEDVVSVDEMKGLICHEALHLAFHHPWIDLPDHWNEEAKNIAQEMEINGIINKETDYELPSSGYVPEEDDNFKVPLNKEETEFLVIENSTQKDIFELYREISRQLPDPPEFDLELPQSGMIGDEEEDEEGDSQSTQSVGGDQDEENNNNDDEEEEQPVASGKEGDEDEEEEDQEETSGGEKGEQEDEDEEERKGDYDLDKQTGFDIHAQGSEEDADTDVGADKDGWDKALSKAIQNAISAGSQPSGVEEKIESLMGHDFDWRDKLDQFVKEQIPKGFTYQRPSPSTRVLNRRYPNQNTVLPDVEYEETIDVVVGIDASGSVSSEMLGYFKADMISIARSYDQVDMIVLSHDTQVHDEWEMRNGQIEKLEEWNPVGRGGTDLRAVFDYVEKYNYNPDLIIEFTDGQGTRPDFVRFPHLWVLAGSHAISRDEVKTGQVIVAEEAKR